MRHATGRCSISSKSGGKRPGVLETNRHLLAKICSKLTLAESGIRWQGVRSSREDTGLVELMDVIGSISRPNRVSSDSPPILKEVEASVIMIVSRL